MKADFHFHFYSRMAIILVLALGIFWLQQSVPAPAIQEVGTFFEINGFAWSEFAGWISLNCRNDFNGDGFLENTCWQDADGDGQHDPGEGVDYGLVSYKKDIKKAYIKGCGWAGSPITIDPTKGEVPLGWVCFSDIKDENGVWIDFPKLTADGVKAIGDRRDDDPWFSDQRSFLCHATSTEPLCDETNSYASILNLATTTDELKDAWKLGFPRGVEVAYGDADYPHPIKGCFNCRSKKVLVCSLDETTTCLIEGETCSPSKGVCIAIETLDVCSNCLDYSYYDGRCSDGSTCKVNGDCSDNNCMPIKTCSNNIDTVCTNDGGCGGVPLSCLARPIGSLKKVIGGYMCSECIIGDYKNVCGLSTYGINGNNCQSCLETYRMPGLMVDDAFGTTRDFYEADYTGGDPTSYHASSTTGVICDPNEKDPKESDYCQRASLCGWAWSSWVAGSSSGLGWFQFAPRIVTSTRPYFSTEAGDIYSKGNIINKYAPPYGRFNASYLIEAGGAINNFFSSSTLSGLYQGELRYRPSIDFWSYSDLTGKYKNALGTIDYLGLITKYSDTNLNKYGSEVVSINDVADLEDEIASGALNNKVLYFANSEGEDLVIGEVLGGVVSSVEIKAEANKSGAGIIVVNGNLVINSNIDYSDIEFNNLKEIPSLVWIVKGNVLINGSVTRTVGTFVVLGKDNSALGVGDYGLFNTEAIASSTLSGDETVNGSSRLFVKGNVIARGFNLGRRYYDVNKLPAESFISDGRLQTNPPLGLTDFGKVVPRFSETPSY